MDPKGEILPLLGQNLFFRTKGGNTNLDFGLPVQGVILKYLTYHMDFGTEDPELKA